MLNRLHDACGNLLSVNLERGVAGASGRNSFAANDGAAEATVGLDQQATYLLDAGGLLGSDRHPRATRKVKTKVEPAEAKRSGTEDHDSSCDPEEQPLASHEVETPAHRLGVSANHAGVIEPLEAGQNVEDCPSRDDGGEHRDQHADREEECEALDAGLRGNKQHRGSDEGDCVGVEDGPEAARVAS